MKTTDYAERIKTLRFSLGKSQKEFALTDLSDMANFFYGLLETNEIGCEIVMHDHIENGLDIEEEGETDDRYRWWTRLTFYGNDKRFLYSADVCNMMKKINENIGDLESYSIP